MVFWNGSGCSVYNPTNNTGTGYSAALGSNYGQAVWTGSQVMVWTAPVSAEPALIGNRGSPQAEPELAAAAIPPRCPRCDKEMVLRTARRGGQAGSNFWGCTSYPRCKGTLPA